MAILFKSSEFFFQKTAAERKLPRCLSYDLSLGFTPNKPIHNLLGHGNFSRVLDLIKVNKPFVVYSLIWIRCPYSTELKWVFLSTQYYGYPVRNIFSNFFCLFFLLILRFLFILLYCLVRCAVLHKWRFIGIRSLIPRERERECCMAWIEIKSFFLILIFLFALLCFAVTCFNQLLYNK